MGRVAIPLTDTQIKNAKAKAKDFTLSDGNGLQLLIKKDGTKLWEFYYLRKSTQKRAKTSFGVYPQTSLKNARDKRAEYHNLINSGIDPIEHYKNQKAIIKELEEKEKNTIDKVSKEFFEREIITKKISQIHQQKEINRLQNHFITHLPKKEKTLVADITYDMSLKILKKLETTDKLETLQRVKSIVIRLFKYLVSEKIITTVDVFANLELYTFKAKPEAKNNPTYTQKEDIKRLYDDILNYKNTFTKYLMLLSIHTAQRQGTLIKAKWSDFNLDDKIWIIPADDMKMRKTHTIPLSDVMIKHLKELYQFTGGGVYLFPNSQSKATRNKYPYISNNTVTKALRIMGHSKEQQTAHGLRAMFKTVCKEHQQSDNLSNEFVERILAHTIGSKVENDYNRAENIKDMRVIIDWWADYLDNLRTI